MLAVLPYNCANDIKIVKKTPASWQHKIKQWQQLSREQETSCQKKCWPEYGGSSSGSSMRLRR